MALQHLGTLNGKKNQATMNAQFVKKVQRVRNAVQGELNFNKTLKLSNLLRMIYPKKNLFQILLSQLSYEEVFLNLILFHY